MKSFDTIQKEYLLQRLEFSRDLDHAISCSITERIPPLEREIDKIDKILLGLFAEKQDIRIASFDSSPIPQS